LERVTVTDEPAVHKAVMACSFLVCAIMPELVYEQSGAFQGKGLEIIVKSVNLPVGAGLGSSAAFSVSVSGAILHLKSLLLPEQLQARANATEVHVQESNLKGIVPRGLLDTINRYAASVLVNFTRRPRVNRKPHVIDGRWVLRS
jgi:mevalonate kinase